MKRILPLFIFGLAFSCEMPAEKNEATVSQINGLHVFIYSQPQSAFRQLGIINGDYFGQMKEATDSEKKFGRKLLDALTTTAENIDFKSKLEMMVKLAKDEYQDADGVIFESEMNQAKVIQFTN